MLKMFIILRPRIHNKVSGHVFSDETSSTIASGSSSSPPPALICSQDDTLTNHPAKRNVMNFMRVLIVDALSLPASPKTQPVIDLLIDAQPENTTHAQQCRYCVSQFNLCSELLLNYF